jgi:hypothetical protein
MLLKRWKQEAPEMVATLEASGQLLPLLQEANEQTLDLLYDLTIVQKRDYRTALEIALRWSSLPAARPQ